MRLKNNDIYSRLCIKAVTGNINEDEKKLLDSWLSQSEENKNEFEKFQVIWNKSILSGMPELSEAEVEWLALNTRIRNFENSEKAKVYIYKKSAGNFFFKFRPAISAALFVILFASLWFVWNLEIKKPDFKLESTGNKQHKEINLADGSHVLLNSGSSLQFPRSFNEKERRITLKGEGFFSVAKDGRPFIILTDNAAITVLGTKFNVRSRDGKTQVYVKDGKVNLAQQNLNRAGVVLSKGELSTVVKSGMPAPPADVDPDPQLGWLEGKLVFNHTPLPEIIEEMERFYDVKILLQDNLLKSYSLTGSFKSSDIENVLSMICLALDLNYIKSPEPAGKTSAQNEYTLSLKN
ncbi:MAG: FecR family protein [Ignavibacteria bacterium]